MNSLSAKEVHEKLSSDENTVLINTLGADSFRAIHIPGSINIPAAKVEDIASADCPASPKADKLITLGYMNVGLTDWLKGRVQFGKS